MNFGFHQITKPLLLWRHLVLFGKPLHKAWLLTVEPSKDVCGPDSKALSPPLSRASTVVCGTRRGLRLQSSQHKHRPRQLLLKEPSFSPGPGLLLPPCSTLSLMLAEHSRFIGYTVNQAGELTWPKMDKFWLIYFSSCQSCFQPDQFPNLFYLGAAHLLVPGWGRGKAQERAGWEELMRFFQVARPGHIDLKRSWHYSMIWSQEPGREGEGSPHNLDHFSDAVYGGVYSEDSGTDVTEGHWSVTGVGSALLWRHGVWDHFPSLGFVVAGRSTVSKAVCFWKHVGRLRQDRWRAATPAAPQDLKFCTKQQKHTSGPGREHQLSWQVPLTSVLNIKHVYNLSWICFPEPQCEISWKRRKGMWAGTILPKKPLFHRILSTGPDSDLLRFIRQHFYSRALKLLGSSQVKALPKASKGMT